MCEIENKISLMVVTIHLSVCHPSIVSTPNLDLACLPVQIWPIMQLVLRQLVLRQLVEVA